MNSTDKSCFKAGQHSSSFVVREGCADDSHHHNPDKGHEKALENHRKYRAAGTTEIRI